MGKAVKVFSVGILAIVIATTTSRSSGSWPCGNFEPPKADVSLFDEAVFRVDDDGDIGTAFLIDSANGYLLSAKHVVKKTLANPSLSIYATTPALPGKSLKLTVVMATSDDSDLVLLKADKPDQIANISALDISLHFPKEKNQFTAKGYPANFGDEKITKPRTQDATVMAAPAEDGDIEVRQVAIGGSSGGPLIDDSGNAIGICRHEVGVGEAVARYIPMGAAEPLLDRIPQSDRVKKLDEQVLKRQVKPEALKPQFTKRASNPSNLELYSWIKHVITSTHQYSASHEYFACPVIPALMDRHLDDTIIWLNPLAQPVEAATVALGVAESQNARGDVDGALKSVSTVWQLPAVSLNPSVRTRALYTQGVSEARLHNLDVAFNDLNEANHIASEIPDEPELKAKIAVALAQVTSSRSATGDFPRVFSLLSQAEETLRPLGPTSALGDVYQQSAFVLERLHDPDAAIAKLQAASDVYASLGDRIGISTVQYRLGVLEETRGNLTDAVAHYRNYLAVNPNGEHAATIHGTLSKNGYGSQDLPGLTSAGENCPKCQPGENVVTATQLVPHGDYVYVPNPPCAQQLPQTANELNKRIAEFAGPAIADFAGPVTSLVNGDAKRLGFIEKALGGEPTAQCQLICVVYPRESKVLSVTLSAGEENQPVKECSLDRDCDIGWSKWLAPFSSQTQSSALTCSVFMNWSHNRTRTASLSVFFKPRDGWKPLK